MTTKYKSEIGEFTAKSLEYEGKFDLNIYRGEVEIYRHPVFCYSLKDLSTVIRKHLGLKGKRIVWKVDHV